jgi:hypothetical protein
LTSTFVVVEPDHSAVPVSVTPTIFEELDARFDHFIPRATWHTARTSVSTKMLLVTPGEGMDNKPV